MLKTFCHGMKSRERKAENIFYVWLFFCEYWGVAQIPNSHFKAVKTKPVLCPLSDRRTFKWLSVLCFVSKAHRKNPRWLRNGKDIKLLSKVSFVHQLWFMAPRLSSSPQKIPQTSCHLLNTPSSTQTVKKKEKKRKKTCRLSEQKQVSPQSSRLSDLSLRLERPCVRRAWH